MRKESPEIRDAKGLKYQRYHADNTQERQRGLTLLFQKTLPKDDINILESFDMIDNGSSIIVGMDNGSQRAQKTILKSQLTGKYAKFDSSHSLYIKPINSVRTTNYDTE